MSAKIIKRWAELTKGAPEISLINQLCPFCKSKEHVLIAQGIDYEYFSCSNIFSFVKCKECSLVFLNPKPEFKDFNIIYPSNYYSHVEAKESKSYNSLVQKAWDTLEEQRIKMFYNYLGKGKRKILDIGCGPGRLLSLIKKYGYYEWELSGVEFGLDDAILAELEGVNIYKGYFEEVDFKEAPFDLLVTQQVIEHAYDPIRMLKKCCGILKPGGYAIFDTPNYDSLDRMIFSRTYWGGYHIPRHMTLFTPKTFSSLAEVSGFEVISIKKMISPVFWVLTVRNLLLGSGVTKKWADKIYYQNLFLLCVSTFIEIINLYLLRKTSNMRIVLRKKVG